MASRIQRDLIGKLNAEIDQHEGLAEVDMRAVREAGGWGRLGDAMVKELRKQMLDEGIGILPFDGPLPTDQNRKVWVYRTDSPLGKIVEAVQDPTRRTAVKLRKLNSSVRTEAEEILGRIAQLSEPYVNGSSDSD